MNTMPILDLKLAAPTPVAARAPGVEQSSEGADFSKTLRESLDAISSKEEAPAGSAKPSKKSQTKTGQDKDDAAVNDASAGQNMPPVVAVVPANLAAALPPGVGQPEGLAVAEAGNDNVIAGGNAQALATGVVSSMAGAPALPQRLAQNPAGLPVMPQVVAASAAAGGGVRQAVMAAPSANASQAVVVSTPTVQPAVAEATAPQTSQIQQAVSQSVQTSATPATQSQPVQMEVVAELAPQSRATAGRDELDLNQSLLRTGEAATSLQVSANLMNLAEMSFADKALASAVLAPVAEGVPPVEIQFAPGMAPQAGLPARPDGDGEAVLPDDQPAVDALIDRDAPLAGLSAATSGVNQPSVSVPTANVASAPAPAVMVPAAHLNGEIVKFASGGGGRAVMEITSPDLGALKIDLSIDGKGVARMVVEASTSAARDQLEQGMRQLHDDFKGMGLSLNVDVRQGGGSAQQRDSAPQPRAFALNAGDAGAVNEVSARVSVARTMGASDDKSSIHLYA